MGKVLPYLKWRYNKLFKRLYRTLLSQLYRDNHRDIRRSVLIAGSARSGTTWLADIIASQIPSRIMFEPFHSKKVKAFSQFHYFHYMRPNERNDDFLSYCQTIFTGNIRNSWIDREIDHLLPQHRIIKEIRANLFLKWISNEFPEVPIIMIMRHPCAVVLSRMKVDWATDTDIESFLSQPQLINDHLNDKIDVIKRVKTPEEKHAVIWCVHNMVPLRQFGRHSENIFFYENLCCKPEEEIPRLFRLIEHEYRDAVVNYLNVPSSTTVKTSAIVAGNDKVTQWQKELKQEQVKNILSIVRAFGLDSIYGLSPYPV